MLKKDVSAFGLDAPGREGTAYRIVYAVMMVALLTGSAIGFTAWFVHELWPWMVPSAFVACAASLALRCRARKLRDAATDSGG